jgi:hypothetical protein
MSLFDHRNHAQGPLATIRTNSVILWTHDYRSTLYKASFRPFLDPQKERLWRGYTWGTLLVIWYLTIGPSLRHISFTGHTFQKRAHDMSEMVCEVKNHGFRPRRDFLAIAQKLKICSQTYFFSLGHENNTFN